MAILNIHVLPNKKVPENAVYIGRANPRLGLAASPFANPFHLDTWLDTQERSRVLERYKEWLWAQIEKGVITREQLRALEGKHLVCYCAPLTCHGQVVQKAVEWAVSPASAEKPRPLARPGS